ncbi:MAG: beta-ketoacyl synthase N-terminal-like domain-containing protein [Verrucomicrobia bacterium]|nr:beta-ketoacyl synthase N-terminal-like domain-containing protein [Verrucomicrobiota bacterium]
MKRRRVKITGIGPVTPAGIGREAFWQGILEPVSRVTKVKRFPEEAGSFVAAEVRDFRLENFLPAVSSKRMPRHTQFALAGAHLALVDAGLELGDLRGRSPLVIVGASLMDFGAINKGVDMIVRKGPINGLPTSVFSASVSSISGTIGEVIGGTTRTLALQSACCAGSDAIGHAAEMVASGETEIALCGGTESPLYFHPMLELKLAGLSPGNPESPETQCRPFDLWRTTGVIGEGACMLVLEPEDSPRPGYGFVEGYAFASDPLAVPGGGMGDAIRLTLANAGLHPDQVESINAWGPGHKIIDAAEAGALSRVFGAGLGLIPAVSIKGSVGNPLGAGGAIQVGCAALSIARGVVPPTVNWKFPDPACPLNLSAHPRFVPHRNALVNAHGLSGTNACLLLTK